MKALQFSINLPKWITLKILGRISRGILQGAVGHYQACGHTGTPVANHRMGQSQNAYVRFLRQRFKPDFPERVSLCQSFHSYGSNSRPSKVCTVADMLLTKGNGCSCSTLL